MKRMGWIARGAAVAVMAASVAACGQAGTTGTHSSTGASGRPSLDVHYYPGVLAELPLWTAEARGLFARHGVDVNLVPIATGPDAVAAAANGSVDTISFTGGGTMVANAKGQDLRAISGMLKNQVYTILAQPGSGQPKSYPQNVLALKGHTVGVTGRGADTELVVRTLLEEVGLDPDEDVTFLALGSPTNFPAAWRAKRVDYAITGEPMTSLLSDGGRGAEVVIDLRKPGEGNPFTPWIGQALFAKGAAIDGDPRAFAALQAAIDDAIGYIRDPAHLDELVEIVGEQLNLSPALLRDVIREEQAGWSSALTCEQVERVAAWTVSMELLREDEAPTCSEFVWKGAR